MWIKALRLICTGSGSIFQHHFRLYVSDRFTDGLGKWTRMPMMEQPHRAV